IFWRHKNLACRTLFRAAVVTVLPCLINIFAFVLNDFNHYGYVQPMQLEPPAIVSKGPTLLESVIAIFEPSKPDAEQEEAQMQSRYLTALSRCIDAKIQQRLAV